MDPSGSEHARAHAFYTGRVQGVGFRWTTQRVAGGFAITGWVRNLKDGRVELEAEGARKEVEDFLAALLARKRANIRDVALSWLETSQDPPDGFEIRR